MYLYNFYFTGVCSKLNNSQLNVWTLYSTEIHGAAHLYAVFCGTVSQIVY